MSMSKYVTGIVPADKKWQMMKAIWDACEAANVEPPEVVQQFFSYTEPDPNGNLHPIKFRQWAGNSCDGIEVNVDDIPDYVRTIRFIVSY